MGVQACRLPAPKPLKPSKRSARSKPSTTLKPLKPSMASYGRPAQAKATPRPDPSLLLGGPECRSPGLRSQQASQGLLPAQATATPRPDPSLLLRGPACRSPGLRSQQASQGHIHGFLWASKLAVCQPLNP